MSAQRTKTLLLLAILFLSPVLLHAAPARPLVQITDVKIDADIEPANARLTATAQVTITALEDITVATLQLNNGLKITGITDAGGNALQSDRNPITSSVNVALATPLTKGTTTFLTFHYAGSLNGADTSPVEGIKFAAIADPISILLYPGAWFPMTGLYTHRFTAEMHIRVPKGETVIGSGGSIAPPTEELGLHAPIISSRPKTLPTHRVTRLPGTQQAAPAAPAAPTAGFTVGRPSADQVQFDFFWKKPGFPGTIIAGKFLPGVHAPDARNVTIYTTEAHKANAKEYATTAARQLEYFTSTFGQPESTNLNVVEIPSDSVAASWGPEIAAIAANRIGEKNSYRLLANTISRQWWGSETSPATLNDAWITNGMARYGELMWLEDSAGKTAYQAAINDVSAGALAYDTAPLSTLARVDPWSPQFQSMTLEKGAMVYHMLRNMIGDDNFIAFLRGVLSQHTDKSVTSSDVQEIAAAHANGQNMVAFFAQWIDGSGAPTFNNKYTVYRLGGGKGFRTIGSISQDLDLFRMPVDLRIETDGRTENRKIDVSGTDSSYTVDTFGRPRRIIIDPDNKVLKSTPDMAVKVAVLKGQQLVAQGDLVGALAEYQKALESNKNSSLAAYRIAEVFFTQRNYQSAANSYRDALRGDDDPKWTEVWSHIGLGKIFDITGQRDRAVNEYRLAVQTNDNTQGAINEARALLQKPYTQPKPTN